MLKPNYCPTCEHAYVVNEPPEDGHCGDCGTELIPIPPMTAPLPKD